jgi:hypothetical protein
LQWFKDAKERQSEPVAWMSVELNGRTVLATYEFETAIPLYTHPAKEYKPNQTLECSFDLAGFKPPAKTLTDEEIEDALYVADITLDNLSDGDISMERIKAFVRTILKKASDK